MTIDITTAQPGDRVLIEAEFARHADGKHIVVAAGHDASWCSFPVPVASIIKVERPA